MPIYLYECPECNANESMLRNYSEINDAVTCDCGANKRNIITGCTIKPSLGGAHKRLTPPSVGHLDKSTKAYQKQMDDTHSSYYAPGDTFGSEGLKGHKARQLKQAQMAKGRTDFTK